MLLDNYQFLFIHAAEYGVSSHFQTRLIASVPVIYAWQSTVIDSIVRPSVYITDRVISL